MAFEFRFGPSKEKKKRSFWDYCEITASTLTLIAANIFTIFLALKNGWGLMTILWIYWFQSVTIGVFNFIRILTMKSFTTDNFYIDGKTVPPTPAVKYSTASFFAFHYGLFHFVYFVFLMVGTGLNAGKGFGVSTVWFVLASAATFAGNHAFSFFRNFSEMRERTQNIGRVMFFPYARIVPMHLCIVLGFVFKASTAGIIVFMALKTVADVVMHQVEHADEARER